MAAYLWRRLGGFALAPRAGLGLLLVVGYLLAVLGHPTWQPVAMKEGSESFACQFSACGCRSAQQCRTNCCCRPKPVKPKSCCTSPEHGPREASHESDHRPGWVVGFMARECQGSGADWIQLGWVALPSPAVGVEGVPPAAPKLDFVSCGYLPPDLGRIDRPG